MAAAGRAAKHSLFASRSGCASLGSRQLGGAQINHGYRSRQVTIERDEHGFDALAPWGTRHGRPPDGHRRGPKSALACLTSPCPLQAGSRSTFMRTDPDESPLWCSTGLLSGDPPAGRSSESCAMHSASSLNTTFPFTPFPTTIWKRSRNSPSSRPFRFCCCRTSTRLSSVASASSTIRSAAMTQCSTASPTPGCTSRTKKAA